MPKKKTQAAEIAALQKNQNRDSAVQGGTHGSVKQAIRLVEPRRTRGLHPPVRSWRLLRISTREASYTAGAAPAARNPVHAHTAERVGAAIQPRRDFPPQYRSAAHRPAHSSPDCQRGQPDDRPARGPPRRRIRSCVRPNCCGCRTCRRGPATGATMAKSKTLPASSSKRARVTCRASVARPWTWTAATPCSRR